MICIDESPPLCPLTADLPQCFFKKPSIFDMEGNWLSFPKHMGNKQPTPKDSISTSGAADWEITNLSPQTTVRDLSQYLCSITGGRAKDFKISCLTPRRLSRPKFLRFRITCKGEFGQILMDENFWDDDIVVKSFTVKEKLKVIEPRRPQSAIKKSKKSHCNRVEKSGTSRSKNISKLKSDGSAARGDSTMIQNSYKKNINTPAKSKHTTPTNTSRKSQGLKNNNIAKITNSKTNAPLSTGSNIIEKNQINKNVLPNGGDVVVGHEPSGLSPFAPPFVLNGLPPLMNQHFLWGGLHPMLAHPWALPHTMSPAMSQFGMMNQQLLPQPVRI